MAHLHAILAAESPAAILIKRGPGRCSCTIGWDRVTDTFELGQWLKQRIDHDGADLSPDGKLFVYFVNTQKWGEEHGVYRAISRAPWLKALAFWSTDSWTKGPGVGMFFRDQDGQVKLQAWPQIPKWDHVDMEVVAELPDCPPWSKMVTGCYLWKRLQRDGWTAAPSWVESAKVDADEFARRFEINPPRMAFEKPLRHGWKLRQAEGDWSNGDHNRPIGFKTFAIVSPDGTVQDQPDWEWAELDPDRNRIVWTAGCILFAAGVSRDGMETANLLLNTRDMRFKPRQAPY